MKIEYTSSPHNNWAVVEIPEDYPNQRKADDAVDYSLYKFWNFMNSRNSIMDRIDMELFVQASLRTLKTRYELTEQEIDELEPKIRDTLLPAALNDHFTTLQNSCDSLVQYFATLDVQKIRKFIPSGYDNSDYDKLSELLDNDDYENQYYANKFIISVYSSIISLIDKLPRGYNISPDIPEKDFVKFITFSVKYQMMKEYYCYSPAYDQILPDFSVKVLPLIAKKMKRKIKLV